MSVFLPNEVNINNIKFGDIKTMSSGGKIVYVNYGKEDTKGVNYDDLNIQTPYLRLPFDVSRFKDPENHTEKYTFNGSLDNHEDDQNVKELYDKLCEIDEKVKKYAKDNSVVFFKKKTMSDETINELYNPIVKLSRDSETGEPNGKYSPMIKIKINRKDDKFQCKMYDNKKTEFDINNETEEPFNIEKILCKNTRCKILIRCTGVWIINGKFGCSWKAVQMKFNVAKKDLDDYAFRDDDSDGFVSSESEDEEKNKDEDKGESESDSESDSESEEEEIVEVKPKKKVRKAKTSK